MAIKDWVTNYPAALDTNVEQPTIVDAADRTRAAQINSMAAMLQALQAQVGSDNLEQYTLREQLKNHYDHDQEFSGATIPTDGEGSWQEQTFEKSGTFSYTDKVTITGGASFRGAVSYLVDRRRGGVEFSCHITSNGAVNTNALMGLNGQDGGAYVFWGLDRTGASAWRVALFDSITVPVLQLNIGNVNNAWFKLRYDGYIYSAFYSLNSEANEPDDNEWIYATAIGYQKVMEIRRFSINAGRVTAGTQIPNTVGRHVKVRFW